MIRDNVPGCNSPQTWQSRLSVLQGNNSLYCVTVVHPPHVKLIVRAQAMTDGKAALALAQLHAADLLPGIWVPPQEVRDLRALVAQRDKMRKISTTAKNRLLNALHRHHILAPKGHAFSQKNRSFWEELDLLPAENSILLSDLDTLDFAEGQKKTLESKPNSRLLSFNVG